MRRASSTDANHTEIVRVLQGAHMSVFQAHGVGQGFPDLVGGGRMPCPCGSGKLLRQTKIVEVKTAKGILTPDQKEFHDTWRGQLDIARTTDEALRAVGVKY